MELTMLDTRATGHHIRSANLVLLAFAGGQGCNREQPAPDSSQIASPAATPAPATDDSAIATNVRAKFDIDDAIRGRRIDVTADGGVVTLQGAVDDPSTKQRAIDVAPEGGRRGSRER
jgi:hypothetical protein